MDAKLRAWYAHRQGLDGSLDGRPPAHVLEQTGWARSVGGDTPYLALFARAGTPRQAVDAAVAALAIHELPAARGCTYVVPASAFALALRAGQNFTQAEMKVAYKLGVTDKEIDKLREAVVKALGKGPLDPDAIRAAAGPAARSLGAAGKAKGLSTTLPLALGELQARGDIRRLPAEGRLDRQRFRYTLWKPNPLLGFQRTAGETATELARQFFHWAGPATLAHFQSFSGLGVKASKAATEPLHLEPCEAGSDRLLLPAGRAALAAFQAPREPHYALLGMLDSIALLREELDGWSGSGLLPHHPIVDRGLLVGFWDYDPATESIAWRALIKKNKALEEAVRRTETYVREQLGDARAGSLDSPARRAPRLAALRSAT